MQPAIVAENLTKRFRRSRLPWRRGTVDAVAGVTLEIPSGTVFGLVGPNGAGKTTFMRLVLGLLQPSDGHVELLGEEHGVFGTSALADVGALIEEPRFLPYLSGRANLKQIATLLGSHAHATIDDALADVGLAERGNDKVKTYSLGMRQRLGLARCMLGRPKLLVLDEPTNGMDPQGIADTRDLLKRYVNEHNATVVLSSHLLQGVEQLCDSVAFMDNGKIVRTGAIGSFAPSTRSWRIRASRPSEAMQLIQALAKESSWDLSSIDVESNVVVLAIDGEHDSAAINRTLVDAGHDVSELIPETPSLEAIYRDTIGTNHAVRWSV